MHIIVPFAYIKDDNFNKILATGQLRPLAAWLSAATDKALSAPLYLSSPPELLIANLHNMAADDGLLPYGELYARRQGYWQPGTFWAQAILCSWQVTTQTVTLQPFETLAVSDAENQLLLNELNAFCATDGITFYPTATNGQWLASSALFEQLPTGSLGQLSHYQPEVQLLPAATSQAGKILMRLQQETQMLLHTHPINQARRENNSMPLNGVIFTATGSLPTNYQQPNLRIQHINSATDKLAAEADIIIINLLTEAARQHDCRQWQQQWLNICNLLLPQLQLLTGCLKPFTISLCSNDQYLSFSFTARPWWQKLTTKLKIHRPSLQQLLQELN